MDKIKNAKSKAKSIIESDGKIGFLKRIIKSIYWRIRNIISKILINKKLKKQRVKSQKDAKLDIILKRLKKVSKKYRNKSKKANNNSIESTLPIYSVEPLVSVLMPVYNHANILKEAIDSILTQTYTNLQVIILNDGSTDNFMEVIEQYNYDKRIIVYSQKNQKLPRALTHLHSYAEGEFITWTSADNVMAKNMIETLVTSILKNPNAALVYGDIAVIDENGKYYFGDYRDNERDIKEKHIIRLLREDKPLSEETDNYINSCFLYRKICSDMIFGEYSDDLVGVEDYDFWLKLQKMGDLVHVRNEEPLYFYRVHKNTMSHDLITTKLESHIKRVSNLIKYDQDRKKYCNKRIYIDMSNKIDADIKQTIENNLELLPCYSNIYNDLKGENNKIIKIIGSNEEIKSEVSVRVDNNRYEYFNDNIKINSIDIGIDINKLAYKVRSYNRQKIIINNINNLDNTVIGCHCDLKNIDIQVLSNLLESNSDTIFVLLDTDENFKIKNLNESYNNLRYYPNEEYGKCYNLYSTFSQVYSPIMLTKKDQNKVNMQNCVLGWTIKKWINYPKICTNISSLPFTIPYEMGFDFITSKNLNIDDKYENILDNYIYSYSTKGRLEYLLKLYNGNTQEIHIKRPDFEINDIPKIDKPIQIYLDRFEIKSNKLKQGWIGILVDNMDKGGLEQVIVSIVIEFKKLGLDVRVLCANKGGYLAEYLKSKNIEVKEFYKNKLEFVKYLSTNRPVIINSHYSHNFLNEVKKLDIPIIETIHNMYVFWTKYDWEKEKERIKNFDHMIAVSEKVKEYYLNINKNVTSDKISVVGNSVDSSRCVGLNEKITKRILGIKEEEFVFLELGSIDIRKNQILAITAFEIFYNNVSKNSKLLIVGNIQDDIYYKKTIVPLISKMKSKNNIIILNYKKDVSSIINITNCMILPSYFEGWSIAATESLYMGVPIIHSECGSVKELCINEHGLSISNSMPNIENSTYEKFCKYIESNPVTEKSIDELYKAMKQMYIHKDKWIKNKELIKKSSKQKYIMSDMIKGYIKLYEEISNKK